MSFWFFMVRGFGRQGSGFPELCLSVWAEGWRFLGFFLLCFWFCGDSDRWMATLNQSSSAGPGDGPATRPSLLARLRWSGVDPIAEEDWRCFLEIYEPLLIANALRRGLNRTQAEDVVQEILVGIGRRLEEFEYRPGKCRFRTWLFRVAEYKIVDFWRRQQRQLPELGGGTESAGGQDRCALVPDTSTLEPDAAWDVKFEEELLQIARRRAGQRASPMNFRLYLYHVVNGHDVEATVAAFRESGVTAAKVHLAKLRVLKLVEEELQKLWRRYGE